MTDQLQSENDELRERVKTLRQKLPSANLLTINPDLAGLPILTSDQAADLLGTTEAEACDLLREYLREDQAGRAVCLQRDFDLVVAGLARGKPTGLAEKPAAGYL